MILSVRYRNHFPVVQFQNQAHIWNPHGTGHVCKTIWGTEGTPIFFFFFHRRRRLRFPKWAPQAPQRGRRRRPKMAPTAPLPGGRGKSRRRRVFRAYIYISEYKHEIRILISSLISKIKIYYKYYICEYIGTASFTCQNTCET